MPRYFFDLTDGSRDPDTTGTELPDREAAEREAIRFLGEVLKHEPGRLADGTLKVELQDEDRRPRCVITVSVVEPADD